MSAVVNTPLRMRVGSDVWWNSPPSPCLNVSRGQFEDYTVIVLPNTIPPVVDFDVTVLDICQGIVSFTDQSLYNPTTWFWDFGDNIGLSTLQNPFYTYNIPGTYTVTLIVTNPYGSDTISQQVVINSLVAGFTVSSDTVGIGEVVNFNDNSIGADTWYWEFGDGFSSTLQSTFHAYFSVGTYTVTLTVSNTSGCIEQFMQQIIVDSVSTGIGESTYYYPELKVYPNPNTGKFIIEINMVKGRDIEIKLLDMIGREVYQEDLNMLPGYYHQEIDLESYGKGIYNLQIIIPDIKVINKKIIIE